jgi:hypothetical protein
MVVMLKAGRWSRRQKFSAMPQIQMVVGYSEVLNPFWLRRPATIRIC